MLRHRHCLSRTCEYYLKNVASSPRPRAVARSLKPDRSTAFNGLLKNKTHTVNGVNRVKMSSPALAMASWPRVYDNGPFASSRRFAKSLRIPTYPPTPGRWSRSLKLITRSKVGCAAAAAAAAASADGAMYVLKRRSAEAVPPLDAKTYHTIFYVCTW